MLGDWEDKDEELRTRVFQRVNLYAFVATHGWPTVPRPPRWQPTLSPVSSHRGCSQSFSSLGSNNSSVEKGAEGTNSLRRRRPQLQLQLRPRSDSARRKGQKALST